MFAAHLFVQHNFFVCQPIKKVEMFLLSGLYLLQLASDAHC